ncbi:MAG: hypothetical protein KAJ11_13665, partial [Alphaproteobacteria bacterium]|nr:hypothetical protein [Alphaproteobacteria bacterium]
AWDRFDLGQPRQLPAGQRAGGGRRISIGSVVVRAPSSYLEIVPVSRITSTEWTMDEAMTFVISGGAVAPDRMPYSKGSPHAEDS